MGSQTVGKIVTAIAIGYSLLVMTQCTYQSESEFSHWPANCTSSNLLHRIEELDAVRDSATAANLDDVHMVISRNLSSMHRLSGCNQTVIDALDASAHAMENRDFVTYINLRRVLVAEANKLIEQGK